MDCRTYALSTQQQTMGTTVSLRPTCGNDRSASGYRPGTRLEVKTQRHLPGTVFRAFGSLRSCKRTERRWTTDVGCWRREVRVIQHVRESRLETHVQALPKRNDFRQPKGNRCGAGPFKSSYTGIAQTPRVHWRRGKGIDIEVIRPRAVRWDWISYNVGTNDGNSSSRRIGIGLVIGDTHRGGEVLARFEQRNGVQIPPAECVVNQRGVAGPVPASPIRQLIRTGQQKPKASGTDAVAAIGSSVKAILLGQ